MGNTSSVHTASTDGASLASGAEHSRERRHIDENGLESSRPPSGVCLSGQASTAASSPSFRSILKKRRSLAADGQTHELNSELIEYAPAQSDNTQKSQGKKSVSFDDDVTIYHKKKGGQRATQTVSGDAVSPELGTKLCKQQKSAEQGEGPGRKPSTTRISVPRYHSIGSFEVCRKYELRSQDAEFKSSSQENNASRPSPEEYKKHLGIPLVQVDADDLDDDIYIDEEIVQRLIE